MKQQIVVIHGSGSFAHLGRENFLEELQNKKVDIERLKRGRGDWKVRLEEDLGGNYEILSPKMPDADDPQYKHWKLWFEKILPELNEDLIIVGHSLGGVFILKFFSEEDVDKNILGLFSVAPPYLTKEYEENWSERNFDLQDQELKSVTEKYKLSMYFSEDDQLVPFEDCKKFKEILPQACIREFNNYGHFKIEEFPEIIADIKSL